MTETSPLGSIARAPADASTPRALALPLHGGAPSPLVEARIVGDDDEEVPWDGESTGELQVRGPWVARAYYGEDDRRRQVPRRLAAHRRHRGDRRARLHRDHRPREGRDQVGRRVDLLGELENELMAHPDVQEAAVIARPDERWGERPLVCVVPEEGAEVDVRVPSRAPGPAGGEVVAARGDRAHRRGAEDERGQVRQEGAAQPPRGRRAGSRGDRGPLSGALTPSPLDEAAQIWG